jgi:hypothetical protein
MARVAPILLIASICDNSRRGDGIAKWRRQPLSRHQRLLRPLGPPSVSQALVPAGEACPA